jgi:hypothetical protein
MKNSSLSVSLLVAALAAPASGQCLLDRFSTPPGAGVQQSFGASVALDGDRLAVGAAAPSGFGQVHLYREQPSGEWLFEATVVPPSPTLYFGNALALRGDRLAVHDRTAGLVRFYDLSGPVPALETKQISIGAGEFVRLALSDTHLALSIPYWAPTGIFIDGLFRLYREEAGGFVQQLGFSGLIDEVLGSGLDFDGSTLVLGSPGLSSFGKFPLGRVRSYDVLGSQQQLFATLFDPTGQTLTEFGSAVALSGARLAVAAEQDQRVELFERVGNAWQHDGTVVGPPNHFLQTSSLDLSGATLAVAAQRLVAPFEGTVLIYQRLMGNWVLRTELDPPESVDFAARIALQNGRALVGSAGIDGTGAQAAWLWSIPGTGCPGLVADPAELSVSAGGRQDWLASFAPAQAGRIYAVLGSASGSAPGLPIGGFTVPLVVDAWTLFTLQNPNVAPLDKSLGALDGIGAAAGGLVLPAGSPAGLAGLSLHHAAVVLDPLSGAVTAVSAATELALLP